MTSLSLKGCLNIIFSSKTSFSAFSMSSVKLQRYNIYINNIISLCPFKSYSLSSQSFIMSCILPK
ncbi:hypothetical protein KS664_003084 [Clostridium perfringens]|nr:hypothetical protein [Clostridium perfringens]